MKVICLSLLLFCTLSCYNKVDVEADWKNIPIVWGILSHQDTAHYIRVEKAFLTNDINTFEVAQNPASLYHQNITVLLERTTTGETFSLQKIDGNLEGYSRKQGIFANQPNYLYKIKAEDIALMEGESIQLKILKEEQSSPITAETIILGNMEMISGLQNHTFIDFKKGLSTRLVWKPGEGGVFFDIRLYLHLEEQINQQWIPKTLDWSLAKNLTRSSSTKMRYAFKGLRFYQFLLNELDTTQTILRRFRSVDLLISAGGQEFIDYQNNGLSNQYITGAETPPVYTNLSEGRGLFTSRSHLNIENIELTERTLDFLIDSELTDVLHFQY